MADMDGVAEVEPPTISNKLSMFWGNTEFQINPITAHNCRLSLGLSATTEMLGLVGSASRHFAA